MAGFKRSLAVIIGINDYGHGVPPLRTAVNDARRLRSLLEKDYKYETWLCLNRHATRAWIDRLFKQELPGALGPDDRLLFYFAGHGVALDGDDGPNGYLLPQDARREDAATFLPMQEMYEALERLECRHLLVILDCCFAGTIRWSSTRDVRPLPRVIHRERYERFIEDRAWQAITSTAFNQKALDTLPVLNGQVVGKRDDGREHSPFARTLFDALKGKGDIVPPAEDGGPPGDGVITATELYLYLRDHVETLTTAQGRRQTPGLWPLGKHDKGEFIFLVPGGKLRLDPAPPLTEANNPYRGLKPFGEVHEKLFYGRTEEKAELCRRVLAGPERPLVVVSGVSGVGKTSLLMAGLYPRLRPPEGGRCHPLPPFTPGDSPLQDFVRLLSAAQETTAPYASRPRDWQRDEGALAALVAEWRKDHAGELLLLAIDDFDKFVAASQTNAGGQHLLALLSRALELQSEAFRLVLLVRSDFSADHLPQPLQERWDESRLTLAPPPRAQLREMIEGPASERVVYFEPAGLVEQLVDEVSGEAGALCWLSLTLNKMYFKYFVERGREDRSLRDEDYRALGGVAELMRQRAAEAEHSLTATRAVTWRRLLQRMAEPRGQEVVGRRVPLSELVYASAEENHRVVEVLEHGVSARLLVVGRDEGGAPYMEASHRALVRDVARGDLSLQEAVTEDAAEWLKGGKVSAQLWADGPRLQHAERTLKSENNWLNRLETEFIKGSLDKRSRGRLLRNGLYAVASVLLAAVMVTTLVLRDRDIQSRSEAAQNLYLAANVESEERADPLKALLFVSKALAVAPETDARRGVYLSRALHLAAKSPLWIVNAEEQLVASDFSPRRDKVVVVTKDGIIGVLNPRTGERYATPASAPGTMHTARLGSTTTDDLAPRFAPTFTALKPVFSLDGRWIAALLEEGRVGEETGRTTKLRVWEAETGKLRFEVAADLPASSYIKSSHPTALSFAADGETVILTLQKSDGPGFELIAWECATGQRRKYAAPLESRLPFRLSRNPSRNWAVAVSADYGYKKFELRVVDVVTGATVKMLNRDSPFFDPSLSPDAGWVVARVSKGGSREPQTLWAISLETHQLIEKDVSFFPGGVPNMGFSVADVGREAGKVLLITEKTPFESDDHKVLVWDRGTNQLERLENVDERASSAAFVADESRVAIVSPDHKILLWDVQSRQALGEPFRVPRDTHSYYLSPDGRTLGTVCCNTTPSMAKTGGVAVWSLDGILTPETGARALPLSNSRLLAARFAPDGGTVAGLFYDPRASSLSTAELKMQLWDVSSAEPRWEQPRPVGAYQPHHGAVTATLDFSPDGRRVLTLNGNAVSGHSLRLWDAANGQLLYTLNGRFLAATFNKDGTRIVTVEHGEPASAGERSVRERYADSGTPVPDGLTKHAEGDGNFLGFSDNGQFYLMAPKGDYGHTVYTAFTVWSVQARAPVTQQFYWLSHREARFAVALLRHARDIKVHHGQLFYATIGSSTVQFGHSAIGAHLLNPETQSPLPAPNGLDDSDPANILASPDGEWLVTVSPSRGQRVWEMATGLPLSEVIAPGRESFATTLRRNGRELLTVSDGGLIRGRIITVIADHRERQSDWAGHMGEALTGMRLLDGREVKAIPQEEYVRLRKNFFDSLSRAASSGGEAARFLLKRSELPHS